MGENKTAVILLGGDEERLKASKGIYRPVVKIKSCTVVEMAVRKLRENSFKTIFVIARHNLLTKIFEILKDGTAYGVKVNYIEEKVSNGSADSLRLLKGKVKSNFLVVYGDIVFNKINIRSYGTST